MTLDFYRCDPHGSAHVSYARIANMIPGLTRHTHARVEREDG